MDWKRRHTAGAILVALTTIAVNIPTGDPFRLSGGLVGAVVAGVLWVWVISAPIQWATRKYRKRGDEGEPPTREPEAAD
jgi:hypothetical protein